MKNTLKTIAAVILLIATLSACQQQADINSLLENETSRNEIYAAIVADHEYSQELMAKMMEDNHTLMMMKGNSDMMNMMLSNNEGMIEMMKQNPELTHGMMSNMMNMAESDSSMCTHMMAMMKDKPTVMKQMMGMMHKDGMLKIVEGKGDKNLHPGHH